MAERSQYQYQPVTGPVWREPVAEKLAWLPRVQQPARQQVCGRVGDFARPEFEALYKPERLEWTPADRYRGRALSRAANDWSVYPQQIAAPAYDPQTLEWGVQGRYPQNPLERRKLGDFSQPPFPALYDPRALEWSPQGRYPQVPVERRRLGDFQQPPFPALYDPSRVEWQAEDRYYGRSLKRPPLDWTVFQQPIAGQVFDPTTLDWMPRGTAPRVPVELRKVGDFQQPAFDSLYKPAGLQWWQPERYSGKSLPAARVDWTVWPQPVAAPYSPQVMDWQARGSYPRVPVELRRIGAFVQPPFPALYKPEGMQWLLTGQQPKRGIRFIYTGSWVVDPLQLTVATGPASVLRTYAVQLQKRGLAIALQGRVLRIALQDRVLSIPPQDRDEDL